MTMLGYAFVGQASETALTLEPAGMVVMVLSILGVTGLMGFCISRILREKAPGAHHHVPLDIDTHDTTE